MSYKIEGKKTIVICEVCGKEEIIEEWEKEPMTHIEGIFVYPFTFHGKKYVASLSIRNCNTYKEIIICKDCIQKYKNDLIKEATKTIVKNEENKNPA